MKKFKFLFCLCLISLIGTISTSCSKDDGPSNDSIYGVWANIEDPYDYPLLITKDCIFGEETGAGPYSLLPYVNATYDELKNRFAPNDDFCIYRYDSKNNVYILFSGKQETEDGTILYSTDRPMLMRAMVSNDMLVCEEQWLGDDDYYSDNYNNGYNDGYLTRDQIMSNSKYASIPANVKIDFERVTTYKKVTK